MRTLKFNVKGQILRADEKCNFENIVAGSKNYLVAEFNFDREWLPYKKAAVFVNEGAEYPVLIDGNNITFSWLLSRDVMARAGTVRYIICAKKKNAKQETVNEWNTKIASGNVASGIETT